MKERSLQFSKAGTSDALVLNCISKQSFDNDVEVGAPSKGGPPGYMSLSFHTKMARLNHLFKLTDNGLIVGGAILFPDGDMLNIGRVFVSPEHFRKGYGTFMMREIEAMFPDVPLGVALMAAGAAAVFASAALNWSKLKDTAEYAGGVAIFSRYEKSKDEQTNLRRRNRPSVSLSRFLPIYIIWYKNFRIQQNFKQRA